MCGVPAIALSSKARLVGLHVSAPCREWLEAEEAAEVPLMARKPGVPTCRAVPAPSLSGRAWRRDKR